MQDKHVTTRSNDGTSQAEHKHDVGGEVNMDGMHTYKHMTNAKEYFHVGGENRAGIR